MKLDEWIKELRDSETGTIVLSTEDLLDLEEIKNNLEGMSYLLELHGIE